MSRSPFPVHVRAEASGPLSSELVMLLESVLPVQFVFGGESTAEWSGEILVEDGPRRAQVGARQISSFGLSGDGSAAVESGQREAAIRFSDDADVPFPYRSRFLRTKMTGEAKVLTLNGGEKVLARNERGPVWAVSEEGGVKHFRSGFALPKIPAGGSLVDVLNGDQFVQMLPLLHWLGEIGAGASFHGPPLRACFMFDDPNLHWPRYGWIDYRLLAAHATRENYHVSFATIPLDTWFTHREAADVFRTHADRLSLLVHGNDHTKRELARNYTEASRAFLLGQAIQRVERLERKAGVQVGRVMVPPHGACSEEMLADLPKCGFEAACISHGSLRAHNKAKAWTKKLGYLPSELVEGCPVLPRWGLSCGKNAILLAAYLRQPIVLRGHQQDLKNGVETLDELARFINSLGSVQWRNMTDLSRINAQWRIEGNTCTLKPLGRRVIFRIPEQVTRLVVESPCKDSFESWRVTDTRGAASEARSGEPLALAAEGNRVAAIEAVTRVKAPGTASRPAPASAILRRLITETRDRLLR